MIFSNSERVSEAVADAGGRRRAKALLVVAGRRLLVPPRGATIGRSRDCDIVLDDAGVSRRHAELRPEASATWTIEDLGSTNGVRVNGATVAGAHPLRTGDRIGMGSTEMTFEVTP
jgi:predicted component of type VI protein secretion system